MLENTMLADAIVCVLALACFLAYGYYLTHRG